MNEEDIKKLISSELDKFEDKMEDRLDFVQRNPILDKNPPSVTTSTIKHLIDEQLATTHYGRSHLNVAQANIASGPVKVALDTNSVATGITFNSGSNRFNITTAGKYLITGAVRFKDLTDAARYGAHIYVSNTEVARVDGLSSVTDGNAFFGVGVSDIQNLTTSDYVELFASTSQNGTPDLQAGASVTYLSLIYISE